MSLYCTALLWQSKKTALIFQKLNNWLQLIKVPGNNFTTSRKKAIQWFKIHRIDCMAFYSLVQVRWWGLSYESVYSSTYIKMNVSRKRFKKIIAAGLCSSVKCPYEDTVSLFPLIKLVLSDELWRMMRWEIWHKHLESMDASRFVSTVQAAGRGVMLWGIISWNTLGPLVSNDHHLKPTAYPTSAGDHVPPFVTTA